MLIYRLTLIVILLLLVLFQAAFTPVFTVAFPDLLLITVLAFCWLDRRSEALWAAFLGGVSFDFLTVSIVGVRPILLMAVVFVVCVVRRVSDIFPTRFATAFLISIVWRLYPTSPFDFAQGFAGLVPVLKQVALLAALDGVVFVLLLPVLEIFLERLLAKEDLQLRLGLK